MTVEVKKAPPPGPDFSKLPKWAQEHIKTLERQREAAATALNEFADEQKPSRVFFEDHVCTGEERGPANKVRYIQSHKVTFRHAGIEVEVTLPWDAKDTKDGITVRWSGPHHVLDDIAAIPVSYQQIELKTKEQMR